MLRPVGSGLCSSRSNLQSSFTGDFTGAVGIVYGPDSVCLGVGNGGLTSVNGAGYPDASATCVETDCANNGRSYEVVLSGQDGSDSSRVDVPRRRDARSGGGRRFRVRGAHSCNCAACQARAASGLCSGPRCLASSNQMLTATCKTPLMCMLHHSQSAARVGFVCRRALDPVQQPAISVPTLAVQLQTAIFAVGKACATMAFAAVPSTSMAQPAS